MKIEHPFRLGIACLLLGWGLDQLFWHKAVGISFLIAVVLCLGVGIWLSWTEKIRPIKTNFLLITAALLFSALSVIRQEPLTRALDVGVTFGAMILLALSWSGGRWLQYSFADYFQRGFRFIGSLLAKPWQLLFGVPPTTVQESLEEQPENPPQHNLITHQWFYKPALAILLGLVIALPILLVLVALLSSADLVFAQKIHHLIVFFNWEKLNEYAFRLVLILIAAYFLSASYLHAFLTSADEQLLGVEKPVVPPFLGWLASSVILGSIDVLFAFFVSIQFRYFFGGQAIIHLNGYTYAEYARQGFGELVGVAVISLLVFLSLSAATQRPAVYQRRSFHWLGISLVILVGVILVSAFQRLLLYESAYGFSRIRTTTHVFMVWLGILLVATILLELTRRLRTFPLAALLSLVCFVLTLNVLNVDAFIARQNIYRAGFTKALDFRYLSTLSDDNIPTLFDQFHNSGYSKNLHDQIGAALLCRSYYFEEKRQSKSWQSFHWSTYQAKVYFELFDQELEPYRGPLTYWNKAVILNGQMTNCRFRSGYFD